MRTGMYVSVRWRDKRPLGFVHGQQIRRQFACYGQGRAVAIVAAIQGGLVHGGKVRMSGGGKFGGLDENGLQMRIAFFGQGAAAFLAA